MDPLTVALGAASGLVSPVVDWISGASAKRKKAIEDQSRAYDEMIAETEGEMGKSVTDSLAYKTATNVLNKGYDRAVDKLGQTAAASGMTDEARLGQLSGMNEGYSTGLLAALEKSEAERERLRRQKNNLLLQKIGVGVQNADNTLASQNAWTGGVASVLPMLLPRTPSASGTNMTDEQWAERARVIGLKLG